VAVRFHLYKSPIKHLEELSHTFILWKGFVDKGQRSNNWGRVVHQITRDTSIPARAKSEGKQPLKRTSHHLLCPKKKDQGTVTQLKKTILEKKQSQPLVMNLPRPTPLVPLCLLGNQSTPSCPD